MSDPYFTFRRFAESAGHLPGDEQLRIFESLPPELQAAAWDRECVGLEGRRLLDGEIDFPREGRTPRESGRVSHREAGGDRDDPLLRLSPAIWISALTGAEVPDGGGTIRCPFPDHEDLTPSFQVYETGTRGFYCFGCHRGGTIYTFAAEWWGTGLRGRDFVLLRERLAMALLDGRLD